MAKKHQLPNVRRSGQPVNYAYLRGGNKTAGTGNRRQRRAEYVHPKPKQTEEVINDTANQ